MSINRKFVRWEYAVIFTRSFRLISSSLFSVLSFWTLTANPDAYRHPQALELAKKKGISPEALFYAFCMALGISPMDGSTDEGHMKDDIELMNRIRSGENIFADSSEMAIIGDALGTPNWNTIEEEDEL